jgi:hypothetical protein
VGFLGAREKDVVIPFKELKASTRDGKDWLVLNRTKDELKTAPAFDKKAETNKMWEKQADAFTRLPLASAGRPTAYLDFAHASHMKRLYPRSSLERKPQTNVEKLVPEQKGGGMDTTDLQSLREDLNKLKDTVAEFVSQAGADAVKTARDVECCVSGG